MMDLINIVVFVSLFVCLFVCLFVSLFVVVYLEESLDIFLPLLKSIQVSNRFPPG